MDKFSRNIIIVFLGSSLANFLNLLYQLLIAHRLSSVEFAAFNSILAIYMLAASPLGTIQIAVTKYSSQFNAKNEHRELRFFLSGIFKSSFFFAFLSLLIFYFASKQVISLLKINSISSGYLLALLIASAWISPIFQGAIQGLELFKWFSGVSILSGVFKLALAFIFILFGFNVAGALGALLASSLISAVIFYFPLRHFICLVKTERMNINYKEIISYLFPVALSYFCFIVLVSFDMVLVKYFFTQEQSGVYALAQMIGKICLFLPGAISLVMFPRVSGLNAQNKDTSETLKKSLLYVAILCLISVLVYNLMPDLIMRILTGKINAESIALGRFFSFSMSVYALLYILIAYFLSIKNFRFIKNLVVFTVLQNLAIIFFHHSLVSVQIILCVNGSLLFFINLLLVEGRTNA